MDVKMSKRSTRVCFVNKNNFSSSKRSQITLFVIIAIIIVAAIAAFFIIRGKTAISFLQPSVPNPQEYIDKCVKDNVNNAIDIMLPQGGYLSPSNYHTYMSNKVAFLCYTNLYYKPCQNQEPLYLQHLKSEILSYIRPKVEDCFYSMKQEYEKKNYLVGLEDGEIGIELNPKQASIEILRKLNLAKNEETRSYEKFRIRVNNPIYDLAVIANEIANQEDRFCYFEYLGYMVLYPGFSIEKKDINGEVKIYSIKEKFSGKELVIAIRSCAMPAGI